MSTLPHPVSSRQIASRPFAARNRNRKEAAAVAATSEEQKLIEQVIIGNSEAQTRLFESYTPRLYRIAFNVLLNKEDAEDALQEGWCKAYAKLHTFQGRSSLATWLTRIVINSALMIRRKNRHQIQQTLDEAADDRSALQDSVVDERPTPEEACRNAEMNEFLVQQVDRLPATTRTAFLLFHVEGFTTAESTKRLGINNSALKSRVLRARHRLAQNIVQLFPERRQKTSIKKNCGVNYFSTVGTSNVEGRNDQP